MPLSEKQRAAFRHVDGRGERFAWRDLRKRGGPDTRQDRPNMFFPIYVREDGSRASLEPFSEATPILPIKADGTEGRWRWGYEKVKVNLHLLQGRLSARRLGGVDYRVYLNPNASMEIATPSDPALPDDEDEEEWNDEADELFERTTKPKSFWWGPEISTDRATKQLRAINKTFSRFQYPKPVDLIKRIITLSCSKDDIVLDSFSGSGTTGHAVLDINAEDSGNRPLHSR